MGLCHGPSKNLAKQPDVSSARDDTRCPGPNHPAATPVSVPDHGRPETERRVSRYTRDARRGHLSETEARECAQKGVAELSRRSTGLPAPASQPTVSTSATLATAPARSE